MTWFSSGFLFMQTVMIYEPTNPFTDEPNAGGLILIIGVFCAFLWMGNGKYWQDISQPLYGLLWFYYHLTYPLKVTPEVWGYLSNLTKYNNFNIVLAVIGVVSYVAAVIMTLLWSFKIFGKLLFGKTTIAPMVKSVLLTFFLLPILVGIYYFIKWMFAA
jgi:hypothetical protein